MSMPTFSLQALRIRSEIWPGHVRSMALMRRTPARQNDVFVRNASCACAQSSSVSGRSWKAMLVARGRVLPNQIPRLMPFSTESNGGDSTVSSRTSKKLAAAVSVMKPS